MTRRRAGAAALSWGPAALAAGYAVVFWLAPDPGGAAWRVLAGPLEPMQADSRSFIAFDPRRTAGYPLFLDLVAAVFGSVAAAPKVQLALAAASAWFLGWSFARAMGAPWLAAVLVPAALAASAAARFHAYILSEALFVPLSCAMAGFLALAAARPTARAAFAAALACGLAAAVRPSGAALLAVWPLLLWFVWGRIAGRRARFAAAIAAPLALCAAAEWAAWRAAHPDAPARPTVAGRLLFAKSLLVEPEPPPPADAELAAFIAEARSAAAPFRVLAAGAPDWRARTILLERGQFLLWEPIYARLFRERAKALAARRGTVPDRLLGAAALRGLLAAPGEWAANAWVHYRGLWTQYSIAGPDFARRSGAWVARLDDLPAVRAALPEDRTGRRRPAPRWAAALNGAATSVSFLASLAALAAAALRRLRSGAGGLDPGLAAAALAALAVHASFALLALVNYAHLRYAAAAWPLQAAYCAALAALALRWARRRQRPAS